MRMRVIAGGMLLCSLMAMILMTSGSSGRRFLIFSVPSTYAAPEPEQAQIPGPGQQAMDISRVDIDEGVGEKMRIEVLSPKQPKATQLGGDTPKILIYHTHTTEAYTKTANYTYEESGQWRTHDQEKNIVKVGELLAETLANEYGCNVIHDKTDHEPPKLATSYSRSVNTMLAYKKQYPSITMFIDVHRDAGKDPAYVMIDGKRVARMMFVVGTGEGATGTGFKEMPDFESNYALALDITTRLDQVNPKLMRNIRVKTGRYNQHVSNQCLLVEMGDNANTLEEALNAVPYLAKAIVESAQGIAAPALSQNHTNDPPQPTQTPGALPLAPAS